MAKRRFKRPATNHHEKHFLDISIPTKDNEGKRIVTKAWKNKGVEK